MKTNPFPIAVAFTLLSFSACDRQSSENFSCDTIALNKPFVAALGDVKCLENAQPEDPWTIRFGPMLEDSRCNITGIECVWAGRYVLEATIEIGGEVIKDTFDARIVTDNAWSDTLYHQGYVIILSKVHPAIRSDFNTDSSAYSFDMIIRK